MPQQVGQTYRSLIPAFSDAASIEEALKLYHYGIANYTSQPIPNDSIEGNFRQLKIQIDAVQTNLDNLQSTTGYIRAISQTSSPNIMTAQANNVVPLTIRAIAGQSASLQQWQNSASATVGAISDGGVMYLSGSLAVNSSTAVVDSAFTALISSATSKGIVVKAVASQSANLQEWQNNGGVVLSKVESNGNVVAPNISATTAVSSPKVSVTGVQTLAEFRVRNTYAATSNPTATDGAVGDIWFTYA